MPLLMTKELPRYECLLEASKEFPDLDPWACAVFLHLLRAGEVVSGVSERSLARQNLSWGRFGVLMLLWRSTRMRGAADGNGSCLPAGPHTPAELADAAGVTRATMTGLIDTLERDGLVKRVPDTDDRRVLSVVLTPKAQQLLRQVLPGHFQLMNTLMRSLSETECQKLVHLLNKIIEQAAAMTAAAVH